MKKLFLITTKNEYSQYIKNYYSIYLKNNYDESKLININEVKKSDFKNVEVIITNVNSSKYFKQHKNIIFFLIDKYDYKIPKNFFDFHIDPKITKGSINNYKSNLIYLKNDILKDTFDIIKILDWDTNFWKKKTATLFIPIINKKILKKISLFIKKNKIQFCSYLCDSNNQVSVNLAEHYKFKLTDVRITFQKKITKLKNTSSKSIKLIKANYKNIKEITKQADSIFLTSRYYYDDNFDKNRVNIYYKDWIKKSVLGLFDDYCLILKKNKDKSILGFVSIKENKDNTASIGLIGINKKYQGKGYGFLMLRKLFFYLFLRKIKFLFVVTQGRNIKVQKLYQKSGFAINSSEIWYHKWLS